MSTLTGILTTTAAICLLAGGAAAFNDQPVEVVTLHGSDTHTLDQFGVVGMDWKTIVVGASEHDDTPGNPSRGEAYVFEAVGKDWVEVARLGDMIADELGADDEFGGAVAVEGTLIAVGAGQHDHSGFIKAGAVWLFERRSTGWVRTAKLTASDAAASDVMSTCVISGDTVAAAAMNHGGQIGAIYVFERPADGWTDMTETAKLTGSDVVSGDRLGRGLAMDGHTIVAGADQIGGGAGAVYVFQRPDGGWVDTQEVAKLTPSDGEGGDRFGWSVAIRNRTIVAGAFEDSTEAGSRTGSVYVFTEPDSGWEDATETARLVASIAQPVDQLGISVAVVDDGLVAAGTHADNNATDITGYVCLFASDDGWDSHSETVLVAQESQIDDRFGIRIDVSCDKLIVGATGNDAYGDRAGAAYVFERITEMPGCAACPGDLNCDGLVDVQDLVIVITQWGTCF